MGVPHIPTSCLEIRTLPRYKNIESFLRGKLLN